MRIECSEGWGWNVLCSSDEADAGRVCVLAHPRFFSMSCLYQSDQFIHVRVREHWKNRDFKVTSVCGLNRVCSGGPYGEI